MLLEEEEVMVIKFLVISVIALLVGLVAAVLALGLFNRLLTWLLSPKR